MVNYQNGKIYKIVNDINDKFYVGSTAEHYLSSRFSKHKEKHNTCMSKNLGVDLKECSIILIENYPCKDKPELLRKEREYFDKYKKEYKNVFVNKRKPIILEDERNKLNKEYYLKHDNNNREKRNKQGKIHDTERRKEKVTCECGSIVCKTNLKQHLATAKHIKYVSN